MPAGDDLVSINSFVQHNATACAYLASLSDTLNSSTATSLAQQGSSGALPTLEQLLNGSNTKARVPAAYKTCLSECILGTADFDAVLIGLSDLYEQVSWHYLLLVVSFFQGGLCTCQRCHAGATRGTC